MNISQIRETIVVCVGLGAALYLEVTGQHQTAGTVCTATVFIWVFLL